jgi:hypothetical protein
MLVRSSLVVESNRVSVHLQGVIVHYLVTLWSQRAMIG